MTETAPALLAELAELEDPRMRAVNERHGDDHGVNLSALRGIAKRVKRNPELARELWATDDTAARLLGILLTTPRDWSVEELDAMLREARAPKVLDWVTNYLAMKHKEADRLRELWLGDPADEVAAAGWELTADRVQRSPDGLDLDTLLDTIEAEMASAPRRTQWSMNKTLAYLGIHHPQLRERALAIGERLEVLKDYPTPPNCTSPYAPAWIGEIVGRMDASEAR
ncbi:DNA alkylation repair protein [Salinibacterium sp. ZJ77]|uniref:DNA alkylation repair protein n=1 Tax=Salinibacterium sp. ZJ77 TaxID=2708337 RepID=UPI00142301DE|nr:DNA alkylation repair protein [Salinibacterium sp. ZJ77]